MVEYLLETIPDLREKHPNLSKETVARLMEPPRRGTHHAKMFKGLIKARPSRVENNNHKFSEADHRCFTNIKNARELFALFPEEGVLADCDNMAKIQMNGKTAVSRYHQGQGYFLEKDVPKQACHDFPFSGYTVTCSGYKFLTSLEPYQRLRRFSEFVTSHDIDNLTPEFVQKRFGDIKGVGYFDKLKRLHVEIPRTGPLYLFNRADFFHTANIQTHCNDLVSIFQRQFPAALCIRADRGSDWNPKFMQPVTYFGRLWADMKMDVLWMVYLTADNSAFGNIEREWSHVSKWLAGITFDPRLPGEDKAPCQYGKTQITEQERSKKTEQLFTILLKELEGFMTNKSIEGCAVHVNTVPCRGGAAKYRDNEEWAKFLNYSSELIDKEGNWKFPDWRDKVLFLRFLFAHLVRWEDQIVFTRCYPESKAMTCSHCSKLPEVRAPNILAALHRQGIRSPYFAIPDESHPGHFKSFLQLFKSDEALGSPDIDTTAIPARSKCGTCKIVLMSDAERTRHARWAHQGDPIEKPARKKWKCTFKVAAAKVCDQEFESQRELMDHKNRAGHKGKGPGRLQVGAQPRVPEQIFFFNPNPPENVVRTQPRVPAPENVVRTQPQPAEPRPPRLEGPRQLERNAALGARDRYWQASTSSKNIHSQIREARNEGVTTRKRTAPERFGFEQGSKRGAKRGRK